MEISIDVNAFSKLLKTIATDVVETISIDNMMLKQNRIRGDPGYTQIPVSLFPTPYPLDQYKTAYNYQRPFGELLASMVADPKKNIHKLLANISQLDPFMGRLITVSEAMQEQRDRGEPVQDIQCAILRADYMIDQPTNMLKLVEYNTISVGFVCLGNRTQNLHDYVLEKYGDELPMNYNLMCKRVHCNAVCCDDEIGDQPFHMSKTAQFDNFVAKFDEAIKLYKNSVGLESTTSVWVLFVADPDERNICDQKAIEVALQRRFGVRSMRKTLVEIANEANLDPVSKRLHVAGREIGFVYFRTGYLEEHYKVAGTQAWDEQKWETRLQLESSFAIKCPSIDYHLSGFKKFQQSFSDERVLLDCSNEHTTEKLKNLFKGIWTLEDFGKQGAEVNDVIELAIASPEKYVLKPQKEGGGNNFFDENVRLKLQELKNGQDQGLMSYLLMERIMPPEIPAYLLVQGEVKPMMTLSEFGFYSCVFSTRKDNSHQMLCNEVLGSLMRSKASHLGEGGVSAGSGVIDSPLIVDSDLFRASQGRVKGIIREPQN